MAPSVRSTSSTRSRASARRGSSSCGGWSCRDRTEHASRLDGCGLASGRCATTRMSSRRSLPGPRRLERGARPGLAVVAVARRRSRRLVVAAAPIPRAVSALARARSSPAGGGAARASTLSTRACSLPHVGEAAPARSRSSRAPRATTGSTCAFLRRLDRFGGLVGLREPVLLDLPVGRSPPQGAILELDARLRLPRPASHGFDERTWLRRHGVHVVVLGRTGGSSGGAAGSAATPTGFVAWLARSLAPGLRESGARSWRASCSARTRTCRRISATPSGPPASTTCWRSAARTCSSSPPASSAWPGSCGLPRWLGELGALAGIASYVLAVGAQPSVIRAGIAGALGSIAWLCRPAARPLAFPARRRADPARLEPVQPARRRLPALVRGRRRDLRRRPAREGLVLEGYPVPPGLPRGARGLARLRARDGADPLARSSGGSRSTPCPRTRSPRRSSRRCSGSPSRRPSRLRSPRLRRSDRRRRTAGSPPTWPGAPTCSSGFRAPRSRRTPAAIGAPGGSPRPAPGGSDRYRQGR